jgi:hypothetical protein
MRPVDESDWERGDRYDDYRRPNFLDSSEEFMGKLRLR